MLYEETLPDAPVVAVVAAMERLTLGLSQENTRLSPRAIGTFDPLQHILRAVSSFLFIESVVRFLQPMR